MSTGNFNAGPDTFVAAEDMGAILPPGHEGIGWLAQRGYVPLGYKGDAAKTAETFPVIDGVRYAVPGDRARHREDGNIELLGRDSVTINSGGEKIFVEEVETALASHPAVADVVVAGGPASVGVRRSSPSSRSPKERTPTPMSWLPMPRNRWPATNFPKRSCFAPSSSAVRRAKPITGGRASKR